MTQQLQGLTLDPEGKCLTGKTTDKPANRIVKPQITKCMNVVKTELRNYTFNKYPWKTTVKEPDSSSVEISGKVIQNKKYDDQEELQAFYKKAFGPRRRYSEKERVYQKEAKFFHDHLDFRRHMLIFKRCGDNGDGSRQECPDCKNHHKRKPLPMDFWRRLSLPKRSQGALFFCPETEAGSEHAKSLLHQVSRQYFKINLLIHLIVGL